MELVLIRGLPGSGKSTLARSLDSHEHYEADMFFLDGRGVYTYDPSKIKEAHLWCQERAYEALSSGASVVVSNTFTRLYEMGPYLSMAKLFGASVRVIEAVGSWENVHGVPGSVIENMKQRWEAYEKAGS